MNKPNFNLVYTIWSSITKETKFGFNWLWLRGIINQGPFIALAIIGGGNFLNNYNILLFNIGMWCLFEYSLRESLRINKLSKKNPKLNELKLTTRLYNYLLIGLPEATFFFVGLLILQISTWHLKTILETLLIAIFSLILVSPLISASCFLISKIAENFWDIKFLLPFIMRVLQFTAPVLLIARFDSFHQDLNPFSFPFTFFSVNAYHEGPIKGLYSYIFTLASCLLIFIIYRGKLKDAK